MTRALEFLSSASICPVTGAEVAGSFDRTSVFVFDEDGVSLEMMDESGRSVARPGFDDWRVELLLSPGVCVDVASLACGSGSPEMPKSRLVLFEAMLKHGKGTQSTVMHNIFDH